jgi:tetratricopeptide (TPR) repeat protein
MNLRVSNNCLCFSLFLVFFLSSRQFFSQNKTADSLLQVISTSNSDTVKLNSFIALSDLGDENTLSYSRSALELIDRLAGDKNLKKNWLLTKKGKVYDDLTIFYFNDPSAKDFEKGIAYAEKAKMCYREAGNHLAMINTMRMLSDCYGVQGRSLKQLNTYKEIIPLTRELNDLDGEATLNYLIARTYFEKNDTNLAIQYYEESLRLFKKNKDLQRATILMVQLGAMYASKKNTEKANELIQEGYSNLQKEKDPEVMYTSYNMFGYSLLEIGEYDEAIKNLLKAIELVKNDSIVLCEISVHLAKCYYAKKDIPTALLYYQKAVPIAAAVEDENRLAQSLIGVGNCFLMLHRNKEANEIAKDALALRTKEGSVAGLMYAEKLMARSDSAVGNYKSAHEHFNNYIVLRDKLSGEEIRKEAAIQKFNEEVEKEKHEALLIQTKKDIEAEKEKKSQRIILTAVILGTVLISVFLIIVMRNLRLTRKQKHIIEEKSREIEEKNKDIMDSIKYAKRIQTSQLPTQKFLDRKLGERN